LPAVHTPIANRLLAALTRAEYQRLQPHLETVQLHFGQVLYEAAAPIAHVYFPNDSLVSLLTLVDTHSALEVGMVGPEGMLGTALALGAGVSPVRALVQGTGSAMRMKATPFLRLFRQGLSLQREVLLYTHALMLQIAQTAACNRFHRIEARLARWLLMTRDRVGADHFFLTQEFLGNMLGVRRVGVTHAAHLLKQLRLIDYSRGHIEITNGHGLEAQACSCYEMVKGRHGKG